MLRHSDSAPCEYVARHVTGGSWQLTEEKVRVCAEAEGAGTTLANTASTVTFCAETLVRHSLRLVRRRLCDDTLYR